MRSDQTMAIKKLIYENETISIILIFNQPKKVSTNQYLTKMTESFLFFATKTNSLKKHRL